MNIKLIPQPRAHQRDLERYTRVVGNELENPTLLETEIIYVGWGPGVSFQPFPPPSVVVIQAEAGNSLTYQ